MLWSEEVDFVSVGGGIGGLTAALVAHEAGLNVVVLEKSAKLGGVASLSLGQVWVPANSLEAEAGIRDSAEEGLAYMTWVGGGFAESAHTDAFVRWGSAIIDFLGKHAHVAWRIWRGQPDYYFPVGPGSVTEGRCLEVEPLAGVNLGKWAELTRIPPTARVTNEEQATGSSKTLLAERAEKDFRAKGGGLAAYLIRNAVERGISLRPGCEVVELVRVERRVVGVVVKEDGITKAIRAKRGVLLATSGYDWSPQMVRNFDARTEPASLTMPEITGDHLRMAGMLGARVVSPGVRPQWIDPRFRLGSSLERINTSAPGVIMVNRKGARFSDESFGPSFTAALAHVDVDRPSLANQPFWAIFDDGFRKARAVGSINPGDPLPDEIVSADTPEELAEKLGIDPQGLVAELEQFNLHASEGADPRFGRATRPSTFYKSAASQGAATIGPLTKAPFYGVPLVTASIGIPVAGLAADTIGRVLDWENHVIEGLYVAGNSMAMHDTGIGYQSGYANTRALVFAMLGACHAAGVDPSALGLSRI